MGFIYIYEFHLARSDSLNDCHQSPDKAAARAEFHDTKETLMKAYHEIDASKYPKDVVVRLYEIGWGQVFTGMSDHQLTLLDKDAQTLRTCEYRKIDDWQERTFAKVNYCVCVCDLADLAFANWIVSSLYDSYCQILSKR